MNETPAAQIDRASVEVVTVTLPTGAYRTCVMTWQVSNSFTGEVIASAAGQSLHDWLQHVTAEELAFVGDGMVERIALWAAGMR